MQFYHLHTSNDDQEICTGKQVELIVAEDCKGYVIKHNSVTSKLPNCSRGCINRNSTLRYQTGK